MLAQAFLTPPFVEGTRLRHRMYLGYELVGDRWDGEARGSLRCLIPLLIAKEDDGCAIQ